MANWCGNYLTITGDEALIADLEIQLQPREDRLVYLLDTLDPLENGVYEADQWGSRMDQDTHIDEREHGVIRIAFNTPWCPPLDAFDHIAERFPALIFDLDYDEDMNDLKGCARWENGKRVIDSVFDPEADAASAASRRRLLNNVERWLKGDLTGFTYTLPYEEVTVLGERIGDSYIAIESKPSDRPEPLKGYLHKSVLQKELMSRLHTLLLQIAGLKDESEANGSR